MTLALVAAALVLLLTLTGCDGTGSTYQTPPPATIIRASDGAAPAAAPTVAQTVPPLPPRGAPAATAYPLPEVTPAATPVPGEPYPNPAQTPKK
jgi:hypothetical protein